MFLVDEDFMPRITENTTIAHVGFREILLTQGKSTFVDEVVWPLLQPFVWCAHKRNGKFYAATGIKGPDGKRRTVSLHTLLLPDALEVDHRDGDGLNNRGFNLRPAIRAQQVMNRRKSSGLTSAFKGVSWHAQHGRWYACIGHRGERHFLGLFDSEIEAAKAYDKAALDFFGDFAKLNFTN